MICPFCNIEYDEQEYQAFCPHCHASMNEQIDKINSATKTKGMGCFFAISIFAASTSLPLLIIFILKELF